MKRVNKLIVLGLLFMTSWGCRKVEDMVVINPNAKLVATASASTAVLLKDNAAKDAMTITWVTPDFGFEAAPQYSIAFDKKGGDFKKSVPIGMGSKLTKIFTTAELNNAVINLGITAGTMADVDMRVEVLIGAATKLFSNVMSAKVSTYVDIFNPSTAWGIVGDATPNGWNGPDMPMYKLAGPGNAVVKDNLVAYVTVADGAIKFRRDNAWTVNLGSSGSVEPDPAQTGTLSAGGKNIGVKKGTYKITIDTLLNKYKIEPLSWGIVGDATPNGWNGPDMPMTYDVVADVWKAIVTVVDGNIKFRLNNAWATNYGASTGVDGDPILAAGGLSDGGKNLGVKKGTYLVTLDLNTLKYTFVAFKTWGLVGDATPNGWNGPDQAFTYDFNTRIWKLSGVVLTAASVKFREGNAWTNNFGAATGADGDPILAAGPLLAGGKNLGVTAGTWNFELDLTDAANPKYKAKKQ